MDIVERLREGVAFRPNIAGGFSVDLSGTVEMMNEAADHIATLEAKVAAADGLASMLENCLEVMKTPDMQQCCDGRECGCQGSTVYDEADFYARQELAAYRGAGK